MRRLLLIAMLCLTGCTERVTIDQSISAEDQELAVNSADNLRAGKLDNMLKFSSTQLQRALPGAYKNWAQNLSLVPGPFTIRASRLDQNNDGTTTANIVVEAGSDPNWAVVQFAIRDSDESDRITGLSLSLLKHDPTQFDISEQGLLGYGWLTIMVACACTSIWATILIWRERWLTRRWVWTLGSLFGFVGASLNWATGAWGVGLGFHMFDVGAMKVGAFTPWLLSFWIPVVAVIVIGRWYRRKRAQG